MHKQKCLNVVAALLLTTVVICAQSAPQNATNDPAEAARRYREKQRDTVRIGPEDAKRLFSTLDNVLDFVSRDTGYMRRNVVNRKLLGRKDLDGQFAKAANESSVDEALQQSELVMKKFGLLPNEYGLKAYVTDVVPRQIGGFYNPKDKTMYLLNWIPFEGQQKIMPHELTHALQDQNFDLAKWGKREGEARKPPTMSLNAEDDSERLAVQRAFIEGQAMLVYYDYLIATAPRQDIPREALLKLLHQDLQEYERPYSVKTAPIVLEAAAMFPYREGLSFELEILKQRGKKAAFAGMFARPPKSTHEILQPAAYLANEKAPLFSIPDLKPLLDATFEAYDTGSVGEFDVQVMARQFGRDNDLYSVVPFWKGGGYVAVKRAGKTNNLTTADLSLLYVSNWKSAEAATRFAKLYKAAVTKRLQVQHEDVIEESSCGERPNCFAPLWAARVATNEGPVFLEVWPGNKLIISESFDDKTFSALRKHILTAKPGEASPVSNRELSMRLYESPTFAAFQQRVANEVFERIRARLAD